MCLRRLTALACHLARSGKGGESCFILSLSRVRTWGSGYIHFGNGIQFPGNAFPFPIFASTMYSHTCSLNWFCFPLLFISSRDKNVRQWFVLRSCRHAFQSWCAQHYYCHSWWPLLLSWCDDNVNSKTQILTESPTSVHCGQPRKGKPASSTTLIISRCTPGQSSQAYSQIPWLSLHSSS